MKRTYLTKLAASAVVAALLAAACGDDTESASDTSSSAAPSETSATDAPASEATDSSSPATTSTDPHLAPENGEPLYAQRGPHEVGVTTLVLDDGTPVEVYYPADPDKIEGAEPATYRTDDALPDDLKAIVPPDLDLTVRIDGFRDVPADPDGPYPLLLFSHGTSSYRNYHSALLSGIASHGIVVASTDYLDRGLAAFALGATGPSPEEMTEAELEAAREERAETERATMVSTLDRVLAESDTADGLLSGSVDPDRIAAGGHSAGVGTTAAASVDPRINVAVGWAGATNEFAPDTATMLLLAEGDLAAAPEEAQQVFPDLAEPKAVAVIAEAGHSSFTDFCRNQQEGVDLIQVALDLGFPIPESLVELGYNGCLPDDVAPEDVWPIIQHFTVAWILYQTRVNDDPLGLGDAVAQAFAVPVDYEHQP